MAEVDRLSEWVRQLLTYADQEPAPLAPVDVPAVLRKCLDGFARELQRRRVSAELNVDGVVPAAAAEVLKLALKIVCDQEGIAPKLVAASQDLEALAMDEAEDLPVMQGWRRKLFGDVAQKLKAGELAIVLHKGKARLIPAAGADLKAAE